MRPFVCLVFIALSLALLPMSVSADAAQPAVQQSGFDGSIDVKPGAIDGRVMLESGSADLQAMLGDAGPQGQLRVLVPGYFVGSANVGDGAMSYQLEVCGAGVTLALNGTRNAGLNFAFRDAASRSRSMYRAALGNAGDEHGSVCPGRRPDHPVRGGQQPRPGLLTG